MTYQNEDNPLVALLPLLTQGSDNPLADALAVLLNAAMQYEREKHIGASPYERKEDRNGQANGFKDRSLSTRLGELSVSVPQVRNSSEPFRPQSLEAALLSEKALKVALAEMYVQGISTRKVSAVLESLCGTSVSSMTVSRASQELDTVLSAWRERPLGVFPFVQFDALWCKVRQNGLVKDATVLVASGVGENGKRSLLGVSVSTGEHELHWRSFFESLVARGLRGVRLITSDSHGGLKAARRAVFGGVDAPYVWLKAPMDSWAFFDELLNRAHVVGTPGSGFGPSGEGYFRLTAFNTYEKTVEALQRIKAL